MAIALEEGLYDNQHMKKYILGAVLSLGIVISPAFTEAAGLSSSQIQAILSLLSSFGADSATIANVNVALTGGTPTTAGRPFCHNFSSDLTVGNGGDDVSALNQALALSSIDTTSNTSLFTENTAGDVVSFQAKYGIRQTGYVGPITRERLNTLYGCGNNQQSTQPTQPVPPTNPSVSTPIITNLYVKGSGVITPGAMVVINGYNFDSNSLIELDGNQMLAITPVSYSPTSLIFVLPTSWSAGTHSVRVVQMKTSNVASNSVSFTVTATVSAPTITILTPTGGFYKPGDTIHISWTPVSPGVQNISFISTDGSNAGTVYSDRVNGDPVNTKGFYDYLVSDFFPAPGSYRIQISNPAVSPSWTATSNTITINARQQAPTISPITVLSPNGGEVWHPGETHRISWTPNAVNNVKIYIYDSSVFGSGSTNYITPNGNAVSGLAGYYDWAIPSLNQLPPFNGLGSANYKIRIDNADTNTIIDSSNVPFSIVAPAVSTPTITLFSNKDPNPTTGATLIVWQASSAVNATIDFVCSSSRITFTTDKGNNPICEKGGLWLWNNQVGGNITVSPVGNTEPVSVNFTLTLLDNNGYATKQNQQQINITFPVPIMTSAQIQAILSLLATFGANSTTVANMTNVLNGGTVPSSVASSGLTSAQIQSTLSLLSSFGANSTIIANVSNVLGIASTPPPTAALSSSSANVAPGGTVFLYFSSTNATSCTAPSGNWLGSSGAIGGSYITNPITSSTTFTLQCTGPGGTSPLQSVTVAVGMGV